MDLLINIFGKKTTKRKFPKNEISLTVVDSLKTISSQCVFLLKFDLELDNVYYFFIEPVENVRPVFLFSIV